MLKKKTFRMIVATLVLTLPGSLAWAGDDQLLQTEAGFIQEMGELAIPVAPGVFEVSLVSGERVRVAFGEEGRRYDLARLQAELGELQSAPDAMTKSRRAKVLARAMRGLEEEGEAEKAAVVGLVCYYDFQLDGGHNPGMSSSTTWGSASLARRLLVGPYPPGYTTSKRSAYTFVAATRNTNLPVYQEAYDEVTDGNSRVVAASAQVNCGTSVLPCNQWESFSWVRAYSCVDGYRSIHRLGTGSPGSC